MDAVEGGARCRCAICPRPGTIGAPPPEGAASAMTQIYARQEMEASTYAAAACCRSCAYGQRLRPRPGTGPALRRMWMDELDCEENQVDITRSSLARCWSARAPMRARSDPICGTSAGRPISPTPTTGSAASCTAPTARIASTARAARRMRLRAGAGNLGDAAERVARSTVASCSRLFGTGGLFPLAPLYVRAEPLAQQLWLLFETDAVRRRAVRHLRDPRRRKKSWIGHRSKGGGVAAGSARLASPSRRTSWRSLPLSTSCCWRGMPGST